jgi:hypothetical protein
MGYHRELSANREKCVPADKRETLGAVGAVWKQELGHFLKLKFYMAPRVARPVVNPGDTKDVSDRPRIRALGHSISNGKKRTVIRGCSSSYAMILRSQK